ncbi:MAG: hypothetical protein N3A71_00755 [Candidatus Dojkabacteria bacterium]|nr:hypothetical protein [Candidatus Dojkabacteria bacterium]
MKENIDINKLNQILNAVKIRVTDVKRYTADINNILNMFDKIKNFKLNQHNSDLDRKRVRLPKLREDRPISSKLFPQMKGTYIQVPRVIKK